VFARAAGVGASRPLRCVPGEAPFTEWTAGVQPGRREPLLMSPIAGVNGAIGLAEMAERAAFTSFTAQPASSQRGNDRSMCELLILSLDRTDAGAIHHAAR